MSKPTTKSRKITIMRNHVLSFPELWMRVHIVGPEAHLFPELFAQARCWKETNIDDADLVVFTGGPDVDPALYGENRHTQCFPSKDVTSLYIKTFLHCQANGIPMLGVCLGAQFLAVMLGATLWQHVEGHYGDHDMYEISPHSGIVGDRIPVSSVHHQCIRPNFTNNDVKILGDCNITKSRFTGAGKYLNKNTAEVEAFWAPGICAIGVQGHPEYNGYPRFSKWTLDRIEDLIVFNHILSVQNGTHRLREKYRKYTMPPAVGAYIKKEKI